MKKISIPHAFQTFVSAIELTSKQRTEANDQHVRLREQLQKRLEIHDLLLSGSYKRKTAVRPLDDIDVFAVLKPRRGLDPTVRIDTVLGEIKRALDEAYPNKAARMQNRSVNMAFSKTKVAYDVVPAFPVEGREGVYMIPDRQSGRWIKTNPKEHARRSTEANQRAGQKLIPLLKMVKHANIHHRKPARSFHLEVLSWKLIRTDPGPYLEGFVTLMKGLAERVGAPCGDPANLGPDIRPEPPQIQAAQRWLTRMATLAAEAKALEDAEQSVAAHAKLRQIFGPQWA